jgi:uncharacterized membrane protein
MRNSIKNGFGMLLQRLETPINWAIFIVSLYSIYIILDLSQNNTQNIFLFLFILITIVRAAISLLLFNNVTDKVLENGNLD